MGICLNRMRLCASLPCINMNASVSDSQCEGFPFIPILPFATHSDLASLYLLGPEIGRGQSAIIRHCTSHSSGVVYACKSISKLRLCTVHDVEGVVREVRIMRRLSNHVTAHANANGTGSIVCLHDVVEDEEFVHLITELCHGGELFHRIMKKKYYPEAQAALIIGSLLEIVQFCHSMGVMHRDIKPENILLVEDSDTSAIRLADFGLALEFSPGQKFCGMAGSSYYIAPEVLRGEHSQEVDMWSIGVIMYVLLSGVPPFWGATEQRIFKAIQKGDLSFPPSPWDSISSSAKDMITQMLHLDANLRLTPAQALKHPWICCLQTKVFKDVQSDLTSNTAIPIPMNATSLGSNASRFSPSRNQSLLWTGMSNIAKPELSMFLIDIISNTNRNIHSVSTDKLQPTSQRLQNGWTCTLLSLHGNVETLLVDMGQEKYLVSHDRAKKKIGWKQLKE